MTIKLSATFLVALFAFLYLLPLQGHPLFIPDETRYAEISREMVASGDWVVPRLNGLRYFEKPVMGYWLTAVSISIFGENNFAVRLPSALATGCTALFIFFLCSRYYAPPSRLPLLSVFIYLSTLGVATVGTLAILDPPLTFFLSATLISFFIATEEPPDSTSERGWLLAAGAFAGYAFLTKGFLAFAIPILVAGGYLVLQCRWLDILRMLVLPVCSAVLVSLPWVYLIHQREPDFWNYFFWYEHIHRFFSGTAQHAEPFYYFLAVLPAMLMPWTMLLPASIAGVWKKNQLSGSKRRMLVYCMCWFLFPFFFFSVSNGKLLTYILPCFPPLVILFTYGIVQWLDTGKEKRNYLQWAIGFLMVLMFLVLIIIFGLHIFGPERLWIFDRSWKWLLLSSSLGGMLILLNIAFSNKEEQHKIVLFGLSFVMLLFTIYFTIPTLTLNRKAPGPLIARHAESITTDTYVLSGEEVVRAVCWYLKRDDVYLVEGAGELIYGTKYDENTGHRLLSVADAGEFIKKHSGRVVLIADLDEYSRWQAFLPKPVSVDSSGSKGYLLLTY